MPKDFPAPFLPEDGTLPELKYKNLEQPKEIFRKSSEKYQIYYKENPEAEHMHFVFSGKLNKEMMELMQKTFYASF